MHIDILCFIFQKISSLCMNGGVVECGLGKAIMREVVTEFLIYHVRTHHSSVKNCILLVKSFYFKKFAKSSG